MVVHSALPPQSACETKAAEWAERKRLRSEEIASINEAISVLRSDDARDTFKKSFDSQSFIQLEKKHDHRRKLGLGPPQLREFHILLEVEDLAQLDRAFNQVAARQDPVESFHHAVNALVTDVFFALYRDFPDPVRRRGEEKF